MTGSNSVANLLRNTPKGRLIYKRDLNSIEKESELSNSSFFQGLAKKLGDISLRDMPTNEITDRNLDKSTQDKSTQDRSTQYKSFQDNSLQNLFISSDLPTFQDRQTSPKLLQDTTYSFNEDQSKIKKKTKIKTKDQSINTISNQENIKPDKIDKLAFYENEYQLKTELKIKSIVTNLINHLNEIDEEANIKLSEIRQNFFLSKLKLIEKYNHDWEDQYNQIISKTTTNYDIDESVKSKLDKVEKERLQIQNDLFKLRIKKLKDHQIELNTIYDELNSKFEQKNIKSDDSDSFKKINSLKQKFEILIQKSTPENLNETIVQEAKQQLFDPAIQLATNARIELEQLSKKIERINVEEKKIEKEREQKKIEPISPQQKSDYDGFASESDLKLYIEMHKFKHDLTESIQEFSDNVRFKQYRSNLLLFIKTTVNSLSGAQDQVRDKVDRFTRLFSGQSVEFRNQLLSVNDHKDALNYCFYHTANSFLVTGLKQVLASTKSTHTFGQVMLLLWIRFENFGKILLAFFFEMCPYTVPFYPTRDSNDSLNDESTYFIICGYSLKKDGSLEEEETFLNKMRALMKLYATIIQIPSSMNPLNLNAGWKWLASILNLDPRAAVSPAVIHSFLTITDSKLKAAYGKQFVKLIRYIKQIYLPKIDSLNLKNLQAKSQLESYIDELLKTC